MSDKEFIICSFAVMGLGGEQTPESFHMLLNVVEIK